MHDAVLTISLATAAGVLLVVAGRRLRVPSIVLLLAGGVLLGPEALGWIDPRSLGDGLPTINALAVAIILFEGGLTLDPSGYRRAPSVIKRLLTLGPLLTWLGAGATVALLFDLPASLALMSGALVIVTGPTVISPLLRRLRVKDRLHHVLYWEAVLVDVIGVFVAVLCYEWLTHDPGETLNPLANFGLRLVVGGFLGGAAGIVIAKILKKGWVDAEHTNIFVLACALLTFGVSHALLTEAGILAVVVAGLVVGLARPAQLRYIRGFKLQLTELGIGTIFILLSAKLDLDRFTTWKLVIFLGVLMLVIRPLVVWLSTWGRGFSVREKVFLSWIAPRGIVAAAMASLFAVRLRESGYEDADYLETLTYAVIAGTVTLQGLSAPWVTKVLGLRRPTSGKWLLSGLPTLVEALGAALRRAGIPCVDSGTSAGFRDYDPDDPALAGVASVLVIGPRSAKGIDQETLARMNIQDEATYRWESRSDGRASLSPEEAPAKPVWGALPNPSVVADGLTRGVFSIDVVELGEDDGGRFSENFRPMFVIRDNVAELVSESEPIMDGEFSIVLRRRQPALNRVVDVAILEGEEVTFRSVMERLRNIARQRHGDLPLAALIGGVIEHRDVLPAAIGSGIAIPHGYCDGLEASCCLVAVVPGGVTDLETPDAVPVRLVFLLLSPARDAEEHLKSLAAIASLGHEPDFLDLLCRRNVPERVLRLITERG